jgi:hypothetical protein
MQMTAHGTVGGTTVPTSCVVKESAQNQAEEMGDFGRITSNMICVEPGFGRKRVGGGTYRGVSLATSYADAAKIRLQVRMYLVSYFDHP